MIMTREMRDYYTLKMDDPMKFVYEFISSSGVDDSIKSCISQAKLWGLWKTVSPEKKLEYLEKMHEEEE